MKKDFSILSHKKIIIFDKTGSEIFYNYFYSKDLNILHVRDEIINIPCLIKSFLSFNFNFRGYINTYIQSVKPKIIITFIDNTIFFHRIKKDNPKVITLFIQNGVRSFNPLSLINENNKVDYMFVLTKVEGKRYLNYLDGKYISIGSFKFNFINEKLLLKKKKTYIYSFISQFRKDMLDNNIWKGIYETEKKILPMLLRYALANNITLIIVGASLIKSDQVEEFKFYKKILGAQDGWQLKLRTDIFNNYHNVYNSDLIVSIDSTLGYEGLLTETRSVFFSSRSKFIKDKSRYSAPGGRTLHAKGEFWTDETTYKEFKRIMKFALSTSDSIWKDTVNKYKEYILDYDPKNSKFIKLMKKLNIPLKNGL